MEQLINFFVDEIKVVVECFMEKYELKFGEVLLMFCLVQVGMMKGLVIFEMMELLGQEEVIVWLKFGFEVFDNIV